MGSDTEPTTTTSDARERILAAALELFSERSFKDATTREIARRADVAQPLLNYHYRSKDELWRAADVQDAGVPTGRLISPAV